MSDKKVEKSPYGSFSVQEVMEAEAGTYVIQVGADLFSLPNGKMAFSKDRAEYFYQEVRRGLLHMKENGEEHERKEAHECLLYLKIHPLRIN